MACACKVNRDIAYLQKKYGVKGKQSEKSEIRINFSIIIKKFFISVVCLLLSPLFLITLLLRGNKTISMNKMMQSFVHPFKKVKK